MSGILFTYASTIFGELYFRDSEEPRKTHVIKLLQDLSILQYYAEAIRVSDEVLQCGYCIVLNVLFSRHY